MEDDFKIYIDQLRDGHDRVIKESFSSAFLDIHEKELDFRENVDVNGEAYLAENELIIHWSICTEALVSCSICNEKVPVKIKIDNAYHSESLEEIKSAVFNFKEILRETILLEVPAFAECNEGHCPKRKEMEKFLKRSDSDSVDGKGEYKPFADLDWNSKR